MKRKSHFSVGQRGEQWLMDCIIGGVGRSRYLPIYLALCRKKIVLRVLLEVVRTVLASKCTERAC